MTDKDKGKWVNTDITGSARLVLIQDVGAPITGVRIHQEDVVGNVGDLIFAYEVPLNFSMQKLNSNLTAI